VGHYLSACALMYSATGDKEVKSRGDYLVSDLAKCHAKLPSGHLSAFALEFFGRLQARTRVWVPFYTIHRSWLGCSICTSSAAISRRWKY
jgi:uncharacterized protein